MKTAIAVVWLVLGLAGCAEGDTGADDLSGLVPGPLGAELTEAGACDDGSLWASDGAVVVRVAWAAGGAPDVGEETLPSDAVVVTATGDDDRCAPARDGSPATRGRLVVACSDGDVTFDLVGLEVADGTTFAPTSGLVVPDAC